MLGEEAKRLDVENEIGRGPLHPETRGLLGGRGVIGGVDLDDGEAVGIEGQPFLGGHLLFGIEHVGLDQGGVGPRAGADSDLARWIPSVPLSTPSRNLVTQVRLHEKWSPDSGTRTPLTESLPGRSPVTEFRAVQATVLIRRLPAPAGGGPPPPHRDRRSPPWHASATASPTLVADLAPHVACRSSRHAPSRASPRSRLRASEPATNTSGIGTGPR